jgi:glyoxylase-like metal-dependent hydrolase (beta-lactamase superfamily II)
MNDSSAGSVSEYVEPLPHGVHAIDTGFLRPGFDAAYLIVEDGRAAFVDTGTNHAVPRLLAALTVAGLEPSAVDWLIVTHVHLDHAGGAGLLLQSLPNARLVVHPRGARHMVDPSALFEGARAVYGDAEMARSYGTLLPVPAGRVLATHDAMTLELAGRPLLFFDTPGHARHHHAIWDQRSRGFFTGDTFGLSYREFDVDGRAWLTPTATPVQFEPEPLKASVRRLLGFAPECMYLTHFSRVGDVARLGELLLEQIDAMVALARQCAGTQPERHALLRQGLVRFYLDGLRLHGCRLDAERVLELLEMDIELNAQGLAVWLERAR